MQCITPRYVLTSQNLIFIKENYRFKIENYPKYVSDNYCFIEHLVCAFMFLYFIGTHRHVYTEMLNTGVFAVYLH